MKQFSTEVKIYYRSENSLPWWKFTTERNFHYRSERSWKQMDKPKDSVNKDHYWNFRKIKDRFIKLSTRNSWLRTNIIGRKVKMLTQLRTLSVGKYNIFKDHKYWRFRHQSLLTILSVKCSYIKYRLSSIPCQPLHCKMLILLLINVFHKMAQNVRALEEFRKGKRLLTGRSPCFLLVYLYIVASHPHHI